MRKRGANAYGGDFGREARGMDGDEAHLAGLARGG